MYAGTAGDFGRPFFKFDKFGKNSFTLMWIYVILFLYFKIAEDEHHVKIRTGTF